MSWGSSYQVPMVWVSWRCHTLNWMRGNYICYAHSRNIRSHWPKIIVELFCFQKSKTLFILPSDPEQLGVMASKKMVLSIICHLLWLCHTWPKQLKWGNVYFGSWFQPKVLGLSYCGKAAKWVVSTHWDKDALLATMKWEESRGKILFFNDRPS